MRAPLPGESLWTLLKDLDLLDVIEEATTKICKDSQTLDDANAVFAKLMDIKVNTSINSTLFGRASASRNFIDLNRCLWTTQPKHYKRTLLHEVAHILNTILFRGRGHDRHWRYCAGMLGYTGKLHGVDKRCGGVLVPSRIAARRSNKC